MNKLITNEGKYLLLDLKAEIKQHDWVLNKFTWKVYEAREAYVLELVNKKDKLMFNHKILASQTKLEGIPLLILGNVEEQIKMARKEKIIELISPEAEKCAFEHDETKGEVHFAAYYSFLRGYCLAALSSDKEFTREDMRKAMTHVCYEEEEWNGGIGIDEVINKYFDSLTPQQEMEAEIEMVENYDHSKSIYPNVLQPRLTPEGAITIIRINIH